MFGNMNYCVLNFQTFYMLGVNNIDNNALNILRYSINLDFPKHVHITFKDILPSKTLN